MQLISDIRQYYIDQFTALPADKQFHFATRLSAWQSLPFCAQHLDTVKPSYVKSSKEITRDLSNLLTNPPAAKINAAAARQPYFDKYPDLRGLMLALFRTRHLLAVYNYDARPLLLNLYPLERMQALCDQLLDDTEALKVLSTYAINYLYLVDSILFPVEERPLPVATFTELGTTYDTTKPEHVQLMIYFYTHCIIGASNFYTTPILQSFEEYRAMLATLEQLIGQHFSTINLDNKFEFLVCCRIIGFNSSLYDRIYDEAARSVSQDGTFVIDRHNAHKQSNKTSFADSEHRNVLLIMSATAYPYQR